MTREEFDGLTSEEQMELAHKTIDKATAMALTLARALLEYGAHKPTCTDENICNCGLSPIQHLCADALEHFVMVQSEDETLN